MSLCLRFGVMSKRRYLFLLLVRELDSARACDRTAVVRNTRLYCIRDITTFPSNTTNVMKNAGHTNAA